MKNVMKIFTHIPKTGGISFGAMLSRIYGHSFHRLPARTATEMQDLRKLDVIGTTCLSCELAYGVHTVMGQSGLNKSACQYLTIVRDPVERFISAYYYPFTIMDHHLKREMTRRGTRLDEFHEFALEDEDPSIKPRCNRMTRWLGAWEEGDPFDGSWRHVKLNRYHLELAKLRLQQEYEFAVLEDLRRSMQLISHELNWRPGAYTILHRNKNSSKRTDTPNEVRESIADHNHLDVELYEYATDLHRDRVELRESQISGTST